MKSVLRNLTDGHLSGVDTEREHIKSPVKYHLSPPSCGEGKKVADDKVNSRMKGLHEQHFLQLLGCLKSYRTPARNNMKSFGMYVVMNNVYFTSLYVGNKDRPHHEISEHQDPIKFIYARNSGRCPSVNERAPGMMEDLQYHMLRTKGLNWLNFEHCKAMLAFTQYLILREM